MCYLPTGFTLTVRSKIEQSKHKQKYQDLAIRYFCFLFSGFSLPVSSALKAAHFSRSFSVFKIEKEQIRKKSWKGKSPETTYLQRKFNLKTNISKFQPVFVLALYWDSLKWCGWSKAGKRAEKKAEKPHLYFKNDNKSEKKLGKEWAVLDGTRGVFWMALEQ